MTRITATASSEVALRTYRLALGGMNAGTADAASFTSMLILFDASAAAAYEQIAPMPEHIVVATEARKELLEVVQAICQDLPPEFQSLMERPKSIVGSGVAFWGFVY